MAGRFVCVEIERDLCYYIFEMFLFRALMDVLDQLCVWGENNRE